MKAICFVMSMFLVSSSFAFVYGTLEAGESTVIYDSDHEYRCGYQLTGAKVGVNYEGDYWGVLALVADGEVINSQNIRPNQGLVTLRTFGGLNELCRDHHLIELKNLGREELEIGSVDLSFGARSRR